MALNLVRNTQQPALLGSCKNKHSWHHTDRQKPNYLGQQSPYLKRHQSTPVTLFRQWNIPFNLSLLPLMYLYSSYTPFHTSCSVSTILCTKAEQCSNEPINSHSPYISLPISHKNTSKRRNDTNTWQRNNSLTAGSSSLLYNIWRFSSFIINISMLLLLLTTPCAWRIKEKLWHHIPFFLTNFVNHLINPGLIKIQLIKLNFEDKGYIHTSPMNRTICGSRPGFGSRATCSLFSGPDSVTVNAPKSGGIETSCGSDRGCKQVRYGLRAV